MEGRSSATEIVRILRLSDVFGPAWNLGWTQLGFDSGNLKLPQDLGKRVALVERMGAWFAEHPNQENASLGATAQAAESIHSRFTEVRNQLANQQVEERKLANERKQGGAALRKRIRAVIAEQGWVLADDDDDERWRAFGLTPPAVTKERRCASGAATVAKLASGNAGEELKADGKAA